VRWKFPTKEQSNGDRFLFGLRRQVEYDDQVLHAVSGVVFHFGTDCHDANPQVPRRPDRAVSSLDTQPGCSRRHI
jgi:hypothetical protein